MKYFLRIIIIVIIFSSCTLQRYQLLNTDTNKDFLVNYIKELNKNAEINTYTPLIVLDGKLYRYDIELKENSLQIKKEDIKEIKPMDFVEAIQTYGKTAQGGTIVIKTNKSYEKAKSKPKVVLILVNGKEITQEELKEIDTSMIESINRIWKKDKIKSLTDKKCDLIILISLKKE